MESTMSKLRTNGLRPGNLWVGFLSFFDLGNDYARAALLIGSGSSADVNHQMGEINNFYCFRTTWLAGLQGLADSSTPPSSPPPPPSLPGGSPGGSPKQRRQSRKNQ